MVEVIISYIIMVSELLILSLSSLVERERETAARVGLNENEVKDLGKHLEQHMSYFSGNLGLDVAGLRAQLEKEVQDQIVQLLLVAGASPEEINRDFAAAYQLYKFKLGADEWTWSEEQLRVLEALKELPPSI